MLLRMQLLLNGIKLKANPTQEQRLILSQWMGCAKTIWNAKCEDEHYMTHFSRRFFPIGTYAPIDQSFSQYKNKELTPWLYECPSQILPPIGIKPIGSLLKVNVASQEEKRKVIMEVFI